MTSTLILLLVKDQSFYLRYTKYKLNASWISKLPFYSQDPNYPIPLIECIRGCWAQDYTQRPSAKMIEDSFRSPNCLRLKNSYELKNTTVHAVVVTKVLRGDVVEELIWVASRSGDGCKLMTCTFAEQEDVQFDKVVNQKKAVHPKLYATVSKCFSLTIEYIR